MTKEAEFFYAETIEAEFANQLAALSVQMTQAAKMLRDGYLSGAIERDYLEINAKGCRTLIKRVEAKLKKEVLAKLDDARQGNYDWRKANAKWDETVAATKKRKKPHNK